MDNQYIGLDGNPATPEKAVAKRVKGVCYAKINREGLLLNPNSLYYVPGEEKSYNHQRGKATYNFTKVNEDCYTYYLRFLETKNPAFLRNAERRLIQ